MTLVLYNLISNSVRNSTSGLIRIKCRLLTVSDARQRIDNYLSKMQECEQADSLAKYKINLENNFEAENQRVALLESVYS